MEQYSLASNNQVVDIRNASPQALLSMDNLPSDLKHELFIAAELYTLRMAYPIQARKFTEREVSRTNELWAEIFAGIDHRLLHKAIIRFIAQDRKAFFPSPGQIIAVVEEIAIEEKAEQLSAEQHWAIVAEHERRISSGENCSTCRFCEHRQANSSRLDNSFDKTSNNTATALYCQYPDSYKYEGLYGHGTVASILCECYEPLIMIESLNQPD